MKEACRDWSLFQLVGSREKCPAVERLVRTYQSFMAETSDVIMGGLTIIPNYLSFSTKPTGYNSDGGVIICEFREANCEYRGNGARVLWYATH